MLVKYRALLETLLHFTKAGGILLNYIIQPVERAISNFLLNMPFNGWFVPTYLTDALQAVDGVVIPVINYSGYKYGDMADFSDTGDRYQPFAGYMRIAPENLQITYIPQSPI